jgi:hypothetical protein
MIFRDELAQVYKEADNTEAVFAACDDFIKPMLIEAAKGRKHQLTIAVKELPEIIATNGDKLSSWAHTKGLTVYLVGNSVQFRGWVRTYTQTVHDDLISLIFS